MFIGGFFVCRGACLTNHTIDVAILVLEPPPERKARWMGGYKSAHFELF